MVLQKKNSQDAMRGVYEYVPVLDFSKAWTDDELYAKYDLTSEEISFIDSMIKPMELGGATDAD
jgi:site-specific DNA-methyltransferase (adenine-specific)